MYDTPAFTDAECNAVKDWVRSGGALLLVAGSNRPGGASAKLASRFGVGMSNGRVVDGKNRDQTTPLGNISFTVDNALLSETHPIMRGRSPEERVTRVITYSGQSLTVPPGAEVLLRLASTATETPAVTGAQFREAIAHTQPGGVLSVPGRASVPVAGRAQAVALLYGRGRVAVVGDDAIFLAESIGGVLRAKRSRDQPLRGVRRCGVMPTGSVEPRGSCRTHRHRHRRPATRSAA